MAVPGLKEAAGEGVETGVGHGSSYDGDETIVTVRCGLTVPLYPRLTGLYVSLNRYTKPPSQEEQERIRALSFELDSLLGDLHKIVEEDVPALNELIHQNNVPLIGPG